VPKSQHVHMLEYKPNPLCSKISHDYEVLSFGHKIPNDEIQKFFRRHTLSIQYHKPTNKFRSFIHYALAKYE